MALKRITPKMEKQMAFLLDKGCDVEYQYLDPDLAMLYSFLPGGGQFYAGEQKKRHSLPHIFAIDFPLPSFF